MSMASVPDRLIALALLMQMSMPPNFSTVAATASATDWSSRMSPTIGSAWPPAFSISSAPVYTRPLSLGCGSAVLAISATFAPSRAARTAMASPMPREAPEMNSVFPASVRDTQRILNARVLHVIQDLHVPLALFNSTDARKQETLGALQRKDRRTGA